MSRQTWTPGPPPSGDNATQIKSVIDDNFTELYASGVATLPIWQLSNIFQAIQRIPAFFRRVDPENPDSPGSMFKRFTIASAPDIHTEFDAIERLETFINLIKDDTVLPGSQFGSERVVQALMMQGDLIVDYNTKAEALASWVDWAALVDGFGVDVFGAIGNHDINSRHSLKTDVVLGKTEQRENIIDPVLAETADIVIGASPVCYYYKDYDSGGTSNSFKVRLIVMDQYDMPHDIVGDEYKYQQSLKHYSQAQLTWFAETALDLPSDEWHVIIFSHEGLDHASTQNDSYLVVQQLIDAYAVQGSVDMDDATEDFEYDIDVDFSVINGFNGSVIGWFYGHQHIILVEKIVINAREYNNILCPSADDQSVGWDRQLLSGARDMFTFIVVDTGDKRIFLLRYGIPCDVEGVGLPFGDFGIDTPITY